MRVEAQMADMRADLPTHTQPTTPTRSERERPVRVVRGDEGHLLLRHLEGDREAFATLVSEYRAPVYSYLSRCGVDPDDRDDLFQEIFIKIHRAAGSYQPDRPAHPWIFTIVSNTIRTHLRKRRVRQLVFAEPVDEDPRDPAPDGERRTAAREAAAFVHRELGKLRLVQREVVLLACVEKMPLREVADVLRIPLNTVKTHLRRARLTLAGALARRHGEVTT